MDSRKAVATLPPLRPQVEPQRHFRRAGGRAPWRQGELARGAARRHETRRVSQHHWRIVEAGDPLQLSRRLLSRLVGRAPGPIPGPIERILDGGVEPIDLRERLEAAGGQSIEDVLCIGLVPRD